MSERPPEGRPDTTAAALPVTLFVLVLGTVVFAAYAAIVRPAPFVVDPAETRFWGPHEVSTHLSLIKPFFDARGQTLAHLAMTLATGLAILLGPRLGAAGRLGGAASLLVVALALLAPFYAPGPKPAFFAAALPLLGIVALAGHVRRRSIPNRIAGALVVVALGLATLPGFLRPPDFSRYSWYEMTYGQSHWSLVVGPADLLAEDRRLGADVRPQYGLVLPVVWATAERRIRPFSFGESVHLLLAMHVLYLALAAWLLLRAARGRWPLAALALAMVVPWFHFAHKCLLFPNQSAWRTIAFPLSFALLGVLDRGRPRAVAFRIGALAACALLFSLESGIALCAGLAAFLWFRHGGAGDRARLPSLMLPAVGGVALAPLAFVALVGVALGQFVSLPGLLLSKAAFLSSGGFSGFPFTPDPWPVLMLAHAVVVLVHSALRPLPGFRPAFRAAVSATLVVWFAYYANRPDPWNLSSYYFLYGFLVVDLARRVATCTARRRFDRPFLVAAALLLGIALPNLAAIAAKGADQVRVALGPTLRGEDPPNGAPVSGVFVASGVAREIETRGAFMRGRAPESPVYLTADSYLVPKLSGRLPALPVVDLCWEAMTRAEYERSFEAIERAPAGRVYLDAPGTFADDSACGLFYRQVREDMRRSFAREGTKSGWEIWTRRLSGDEAGAE